MNFVITTFVADINELRKLFKLSSRVKLMSEKCTCKIVKKIHLLSIHEGYDEGNLEICF